MRISSSSYFDKGHATYEQAYDIEEDEKFVIKKKMNTEQQTLTVLLHVQ